MTAFRRCRHCGRTLDAHNARAVICQRPECVSQYQRAYGRARRKAEKAEARATRRLAVCELYRQGYSQVEVARRVGIHQGTVSVILREEGVQVRPLGRPREG